MSRDCRTITNSCKSRKLWISVFFSHEFDCCGLPWFLTNAAFLCQYSQISCTNHYNLNLKWPPLSLFGAMNHVFTYWLPRQWRHTHTHHIQYHLNLWYMEMLTFYTQHQTTVSSHTNIIIRYYQWQNGVGLPVVGLPVVATICRPTILTLLWQVKSLCLVFDTWRERC